MSAEPDNESARLDARLTRLPQWQPPADFAARLAAAAARQAEQPLVKLPSTWSWLLERFRYRLPLTLGASVVALVWAAIPWATLAGNTALPWFVVAGSAAFGLVLTVRLLRTP